jgi:excisionase family DNA binding protein
MEIVTEKLWTVREVAALLRCSRFGVYEMAKDGRLPCIRMSSKRLLFAESAVQAAIEKATTHGADE